MVIKKTFLGITIEPEHRGMNRIFNVESFDYRIALCWLKDDGSYSTSISVNPLFPKLTKTLNCCSIVGIYSSANCRYYSLKVNYFHCIEKCSLNVAFAIYLLTAFKYRENKTQQKKKFHPPEQRISHRICNATFFFVHIFQ